MKPGKQLEELVATLEKVLVSDADTKVVSPYFAKDRTTGRRREHDVAVIVNKGHHEVIVAIECRDRSRPVGVPQVEGFHQKCQDTGVSRGVIVSAKGFCKSAKDKAAHLGIECLLLTEVPKFDWMLAGCMQVYGRHIEEVRCTAVSDSDFGSSNRNFRLHTPDGKEITNQMVIANVQAGIAKLFSERQSQPGECQFKLVIETPGCTIFDLDTNKTYALRRFDVVARVVVQVQEVPLTKLVYESAHGDKAIGRVAVANLDSFPIPGNLVFSRNADETTDVSLVPRRSHMGGSN